MHVVLDITCFKETILFAGIWEPSPRALANQNTFVGTLFDFLPLSKIFPSS